MKILSFEIHDFNRFKMSKIKTIKCDVTSPIQIFIGDNGSGKTSLMNEIHPLAAIKPSYGKNGYKHIKLSHQDHIYDITSDFTAKSSITHSFKQDGVELNTGGTSSIQNELAETYLGYTPLIHSIVHFNYKVCSMSKVDRRTLCLRINPTDLSLIMDLHKSISSRLREHIGNIKLLTTRKLDIEQKIIKQEQLDAYTTEQKTLEQTINDTNNQIFYLKQRLGDVIKEIQDYDKTNVVAPNIQKLKNFSYKVNAFLLHNQHIDKEHPEKQMVQITGELTHVSDTIQSHKKTAASVVGELATYDKNLLECDASLSIETFIRSIHEKETILSTYKSLTSSTIFLIPDDTIDRAYEAYTHITEAIHQLNDRHIRIIHSAASIKRVDKSVAHCSSTLRVLETEMTTCQARIAEYQTIIEELPMGPVTVTATCGTCDYMTNKKRVILENTEKIKALTSKLNTLSQTHARYEKAEAAQVAWLDEQLVAQSCITRILDLVRASAFAPMVDSLAADIATDTNKAIHKLTCVIENQTNLKDKYKLESEIVELVNKIEALKKTNTPVIRILQDIYNKKNHELSTIRDNVLRLQDRAQLLNSTLAVYERFQKIRETTSRLTTEIAAYKAYTILTTTKTFIEELIKEHEAENTVHLKRFNEVNSILKEQQSLKSRYEDEILQTLETVTKEKEKYELIEWGISPITGFPHKQMVEHLNIVINNANVLINQVWSYPLALCPLSVDQPFTYAFKVEANGTMVPDISDLSKGQQSIVDLAFMLSTVLSMKLTDYPVYLDEISDGLDPTHDANLLNLLKLVMDNKYVNQMWIINHEAALYDGFTTSEVLCLMDGNIVDAVTMNEHVQITK